MLAIPSQRSDHSSVSPSGTLTIIHQIRSILYIDVKDKMGMSELRYQALVILPIL